jgi:hypothetical protein
MLVFPMSTVARARHQVLKRFTWFYFIIKSNFRKKRKDNVTDFMNIVRSSIVMFCNTRAYMNINETRDLACIPFLHNTCSFCHFALNFWYYSWTFWHVCFLKILFNIIFSSMLMSPKRPCRSCFLAKFNGFLLCYMFR